MAEKRTHVTSLTDDELTLLDGMFDHGTSFRLLRRRGFWEQWLRRHDLTDDELRTVLHRFIANGWLTAEACERGTDFFLTPAGGAVWESERRPDWRRLVTDRYWRPPGGIPYVTILGLDPEIRDDFWRIGCDAGLFLKRDDSAKRTVIRDHQWIGWKSFPAIYVLMARLFDPNEIGHHEPYRSCEEQRTWWRFPHEISRFWDEPPIG